LRKGFFAFLFDAEKQQLRVNREEGELEMRAMMSLAHMAGAKCSSNGSSSEALQFDQSKMQLRQQP
jgi:hypothetical protein